MVGIVSGIGSIIRDVLDTYRPTADQKLSKRRFWAIVRIAFLIAAILVWYAEHQKVIKLTIEQPIKLEGEIDKVLMSPIDSKGNRYVLFFVSIQNEGALSRVDNYTAKVTINDQVMDDLSLEIIPDSGLSVRNTRFFPLHAIYNITQYPIGKHDPRRGVILFLLNNADKIKDHPQWHLFFADYKGKVYEASISKNYEENVIPFVFEKRQPLFLSPPSPVFSGSDQNVRRIK